MPHSVFYSFYREVDDTVLSGSLHNHIWKALLNYFLLYLHYTFMKMLGLTVILIFSWFFLFYFLTPCPPLLSGRYLQIFTTIHLFKFNFYLLSFISQCFLSYDYTFCVTLCYSLGNAIFSFISVKTRLEHFFKFPSPRWLPVSLKTFGLFCSLSFVWNCPWISCD